MPARAIIFCRRSSMFVRCAILQIQEPPRAGDPVAQNDNTRRDHCEPGAAFFAARSSESPESWGADPPAGPDAAGAGSVDSPESSLTAAAVAAVSNADSFVT